jgi:gliding motility-associated lipoprotein GldD
MYKFFFIIFSLLILISCEDEVLIKPAAFLSLEYPEATYQSLSLNCPYTFEKNTLAELKDKGNCNINLNYPSLKATLYLTYMKVHESNLDSLLRDAQKLTYDHTIKAQTILEQPRVDSIHKVYGMLYMINGNAATQTQFYVTDSTHHFLNGSVYFKVKPNFDSLYPAIMYMRKDVRHLMETLRWKQ